jgi:hypothetical protein
MNDQNNKKFVDYFMMKILERKKKSLKLQKKIEMLLSRFSFVFCSFEFYFFTAL